MHSKAVAVLVLCVALSVASAATECSARAASGGSASAQTSAKAAAAHDHLKEGDRVPDVLFKTQERKLELAADAAPSYDWVDRRTHDIFGGKRVVLFALPGAFTPTCSSSHLPGYEADYDAIRARGVDEVYCLSVNDAFVMRSWGEAQSVAKVKLLPDGAAAFTSAMRMGCNWTSERGFGLRSWRYSMVVDDGVIEKMFVEPNFVENSAPDPFQVSDSKTMLNYLQEKQVK